jgi:hypothetical protein
MNKTGWSGLTLIPCLNDSPEQWVFLSDSFYWIDSFYVAAQHDNAAHSYLVYTKIQNFSFCHATQHRTPNADS